MAIYLRVSSASRCTYTSSMIHNSSPSFRSGDGLATFLTFSSKTPAFKLSTRNLNLNLISLPAKTTCRLKHERSNNFHPLAAPPPRPPPQNSNSDRKLALVMCSTVTVVLAIANRVLYKLALVPMKEYPFFLAQLTSFGYVAIYFSVLYMRYEAGVATDEMLSIPKWPFVLIGLLEALGVVSGMYSAAMLPGPAIPILNQSFLVWQLGFSVLLLGRTYSLNRIAGCFLVAAGVVLAVKSGSHHDQMLSGVGIVWPAMMIASSAFQAVASIIKESVFIDAAKRLKGKLLDIFIVNSFGSGFQGILLSDLPSYLRSGAACFLNVGSNITGCDGAPVLPLLYVITNIAFNISVLNLLQFSSAVVSSLAVMSSVPISIYLLSLPLPFLAEGVSLSPYFVLGSVVLMMGLALYNLPWAHEQDSDIL